MSASEVKGSGSPLPVVPTRMGFYALRKFIIPAAKTRSVSVADATRAVLCMLRVFFAEATKTLHRKEVRDEETDTPLPVCPFALLTRVVQGRIALVLAIGFREGSSADGYEFDFAPYLAVVEPERVADALATINSEKIRVHSLDGIPID